MADYVPTTTDDGTYGFANYWVGTTDDYGFMEGWLFRIEEITTDDNVFDDLSDGEVGVSVELFESADNLYRLYEAVFEQDVPTFTNGEWVSDYKHTADLAVADEESDAMEEIYGYSATATGYGNELNNAFAAIAEKVELAAGNPAHPLNKIKTPDLDENVFDAFEGQQEKAQDISVSAAYSKTITY